MKKSYIYLVLGVSAVIALIVIGLYIREEHPTGNPKNASITNDSTTSEVVDLVTDSRVSNDRGNLSIEELERLAKEQNDKFEKMVGIAPGMTPEEVRQKTLEWYLAEVSKRSRDKKPISFYGKVVDENQRPISEANVRISWNDASSEDGVLSEDLLSNTDGSFAFLEGTATALNVQVWKNGYYTAKSKNQTYFDPSGGGSSPTLPVVFELRERGTGTDLITSRYGVKRDMSIVPPEGGEPVNVDFFNRRVSDTGQLEIRKVTPERDGERGPKEWGITLVLPDGGFVPHNDEFPFGAPEFGYEPTLELQFRPDDPNWTDTVTGQYYIAFGNPRRYGRIELSTGMYNGVRLEYAVNPDGSRYLEPKEEEFRGRTDIPSGRE